VPTFPLAHKLALLEQHNARLLKRLAADAVDERAHAPGATAGGDERRLRGIPVVGRGVAGHISGTRP
jgi:hypothetical protein